MGNYYSSLDVTYLEHFVRRNLKDVCITIGPDVDWTPSVEDIMVYYRRLSDRAKDDFYRGFTSNCDYALATLVFYAVHNMIVDLMDQGDVLRFPYWKTFNWTWVSVNARVYHKNCD